MIEYKLVFSGNLTEECSVDEASANLKNSLKFTDQAIAHLFKPRMKPLVVKTVSSFDKANLLCSRFLELGLILDIVETDNEPIKQTTEAAPPKMVAENTPVVEDSQMAPESRTRIVEHLKGFLSSVFGLSTLIIFLGVYLCYSYMPYPDGMLRNGFVAGLVVLYLGWRGYRRVHQI